MENEKENQLPEEQEIYTPRPRWQVWGARIALVVFILVIVGYYLNIARGGR